MSDSWHENLKSKNRLEIIASARELFLENNFFNVSVKDVCNLAGVSRVTFYKHFKSIDELIFEVQMNVLDNMTEYIVSRDNSDVSGMERLKLILNAWIQFAKEHREQMKFIILFDLYYNTYDSDEELKNKYANFVSKENQNYFLNSAINKGISDGTLRKDINPIRTGYYIFQTIMGVLQRMSYTKLPENNEDITFEDISSSVLEMIINSIKAQNIKN
ncbi:TetR/AcrR family transcriptional regulator [Clostridium sp. YIM B02551]|uniref:TetR/AcrR family transcriptional regulator n=1 Tax=Clostridium sp. YIM B02551 TaxID=2910679 RepID=UPI001EEA591F|nr:TetR/AcrR family transcriptional regulator [Clostridium sp. YIM B02551]